MSRRRSKQVHPAASAFLILLVLIAVQWVWWRFLVWRPAAGAGAGSLGPMPPPREGPVYLFGRADIPVVTYAGDQQPGASDGPSHAARFDRPTGIAVDDKGDLFVADTGNDRIRMVSPAGDTITIAGSEPGLQDGPAARARFRSPCGLCVGPDGAVYVADTGNHAIRRIKDGQVITIVPMNSHTGQANGLKLVSSIAIESGGRQGLLVADAGAGQLREFSTDGEPRGAGTKTAGSPVSVAANPIATALPSGSTLLLGTIALKNIPFEQTDDANEQQAARIKIHHPVGLFPFSKGWLVTDTDHGAVLYVVNGKARVLAGLCTTEGPVRGSVSGDGRTSLFGVLSGIVYDGKRYAYVTDTGNNSIRRLDLSDIEKQ